MKLEMKELSYQYPGSDRPVLEHVQLTVEQGERVGISAPSGRGKTTLCKLAAGYLQADHGEVYVDGKALRTYRGYCPVQLIWQHPELSVDPYCPMGTVIDEGDGITPELLKKLGIRTEWLKRYPAELSGGELQRFCIARALGRRTKFLIADEISTMLDLVTQRQIWQFLIEETEKRGIGMMIVSHDVELLDAVCTRRREL